MNYAKLIAAALAAAALSLPVLGHACDTEDAFIVATRPDVAEAVTMSSTQIDASDDPCGDE